MKRVTLVAAVGAALLLAACSSGQSHQTMGQAAAPAMVAAPTTANMTADQIKAKFINHPTHFQSVAMSPPVTAVGMWHEDGTITSKWRSGSDSGNYSGRWTLTGDRYCVADSAANGGHSHCGTLREQDGKVYELTDDGSVWGIHTFE